MHGYSRRRGSGGAGYASPRNACTSQLMCGAERMATLSLRSVTSKVFRWFCALLRTPRTLLTSCVDWHRRGMAHSVGDSLAARASRAASVSIASSATPLSHVFLLGQKRMIGKRPSIGTRSGTRLTPLSPAHEPRRHRARPLCSTVSSHWLACWLAAVEQIFLSPYLLTNPHTQTASTA